MAQDVRQASNTQKIAKRQRAIAAIGALLEAKPAAEELRETWEQPGWSRDAPASTMDRPKREPRLSDLWRSLDAKKSVKLDEEGKRGVPMWIVVRTCKAAWHHDGTWPLLGCDEELPATSSAAPVPSIYPSHLLLRPKGVNSYTIPEDAQAAASTWMPSKDTRTAGGSVETQEEQDVSPS